VASLEADDEAARECLGVSAVGGVVDCVAEVGDTPIDVGKDCGVETDYVSIGEVVRDWEVRGGAVGGDAEDEFAVGFEGNDREFYRDAWAEEAALDVARKIAASVDREVDGSEVVEAVVEAEGPGSVPIIVGQTTFFATAGAVNCEPGLGLKVDGEESGEKNGEDPENSTAHAPSLVIRCCTGQVTREF
jgi:hypothetical protein